MPDVNLISFNGPHDNYRAVKMEAPLDGTGFDDTVKCSTGLTGFKAQFGVVKGGREDALDVNNRCQELDLAADLWVLRGTMGFTIKGGSRDVRVSGPVEGHGRECDVDLGNASDQSHEETRRVRLNLWRVDGSPIRVRVLNAELPFEEAGSGPYVYVFPWKSRVLRVVTVKVFMEWRRLMRRFSR